MSTFSTVLQEFSASLDQKRKKNLHFPFFQADPAISSIKVPVLPAKVPENTPQTPYRNLKCAFPACVFAKDRLLKFFQENRGKKSAFCPFCDCLINFQEFFQDFSLQKIYEKVWEKFNRSSENVCQSVKIKRNGQCFAEIPEYLRMFLAKNRENFAKSQENPCFLCEIAMPKAEFPMRFAQKCGDFPRISRFSQQELDFFLANLRKGGNPSEIFLEFHGITVFRKELLDFLSEIALSRGIMAVFLIYLQELQRLDGDFRISALLQGFLVQRLDVFTGFVQLSPFPGLKREKSEQLLRKCEEIVVVLWFEDRYLLTFARKSGQTLCLLDFLHADLGEIPTKTAQMLGKAVFSQEFGLENLSFREFRVEKLSFFKDFGDSVALFLYKALKTGNFKEIALKNNEKQQFRNVFAWILFKLASQSRETVYFFDFSLKNPAKDGKSRDLREFSEKKPKKSRLFPEIRQKPRDSSELPVFVEKPKEKSSTFLSFNEFSSQFPRKTQENPQKAREIAENRYEEPANIQGKRYFGREIATIASKKPKIHENSANREELVLEKSVLKEFLREYKENLREKLDFSQAKDGNSEENDGKNVVLSRKQLKNLLQQHENYVKSEFLQEIAAENELISKENGEKSSESEESSHESARKSTKPGKKPKKRKKKREKLRKIQ